MEVLNSCFLGVQLVLVMMIYKRHRKNTKQLELLLQEINREQKEESNPIEQVENPENVQAFEQKKKTIEQEKLLSEVLSEVF